MLKSQIRQQYLQKRKHLSPELHRAWSKIICLKVILGCQIGEAWPKSVGLYAPYKNEVDCLPLFEFFRKQGVVCAFPKTLLSGLDYKRVDDLSQLDEKVLGIKEPNKTLESIQPEWIFVPGIAFTKNGDRIGFGYGHFDKALAKYPTSKYVALAYQFQMLETPFTPDPWDIRMHAVVTNDNLY